MTNHHHIFGGRVSFVLVIRQCRNMSSSSSGSRAAATTHAGTDDHEDATQRLHHQQQMAIQQQQQHLLQTAQLPVTYHLYFESSFSPETFAIFNISEKTSLEGEALLEKIRSYVANIKTQFNFIPEELPERIEKVLMGLHYGWCTLAMDLISGDLNLIQIEKCRPKLNEMLITDIGRAIETLLDTFEVAFMARYTPSPMFSRNLTHSLVSSSLISFHVLPFHHIPSHHVLPFHHIPPPLHSDAAKLVAKTRGQLENTWIDKNRNPLNEAFAFMRYTLVQLLSLHFPFLSSPHHDPLSLFPSFFLSLPPHQCHSPSPPPP